MTVNNEVHGHEVMDMMLNSGKNYTRKTLFEDIIEKFGDSTRFYTCSEGGLDANGLIDFLEQRGKFLGETESFNVNPDSRCDHE